VRIAAGPETGREEIYIKTISAVEDSPGQPKSGPIDLEETMVNSRGAPAGEGSHRNASVTIYENQSVVSKVNHAISGKEDPVTSEAIRQLPWPMCPEREPLSPPTIGEKGIPPSGERNVSLPKISAQTTEADEAVEQRGHETGDNRPAGRMIRESLTAGEIESAESRSGRAVATPAEKQFMRQHIIENQSTPQTRSSAERTGIETYIPVRWNLRQSSVPDLRVTLPQAARDQVEAAVAETQQVHGPKKTEKPESSLRPEQLNTPPEPPRTAEHERVSDPLAAPESKAEASLVFNRNRNLAGLNQTAEGTAKTAVGTMSGLVKGSPVLFGQPDLSAVQVETVGLRNPEFMFRIASRIHTQLMSGDGVVRVQLKPNLLGRLEIHAQTYASNVSVTIKAESEAVREYLESNLHILQKNLQDQGIKLDRLHFAILDDAGSTSWNYQYSSGSRTSQDNRPPRERSSWIPGHPEQEEEVLVEAATLAVLDPNRTFHAVA
jgi:flagellar hook-length control protein FliK